MTDCFALLDEPRRPWLDADSLKAKFLALSAQSHPDRVHNATDLEKQAATDRYAALNKAYETLRDPKERLAHLLELESGRKPGGIEAVPEELMELFATAGSLFRAIDGFLAERDKVTSPLLKVRMFERGMEWTAKLNELASLLNARRGLLEARLKEFSAEWKADRSSTSCLEELGRIFRTLSYVSRWLGQVQERIVRLSL